VKERTMEEFIYYDVQNVKLLIQENKIVKNVTFDQNYKIFGVELNEPWSKLGLNYNIRLQIRDELKAFSNLEEYVNFNRNKWRQLNLNISTGVDGINYFLTEHYQQCQTLFNGFDNKSCSVWSGIVSCLLQYPNRWIKEFKDILEFHQVKDVKECLKFLKRSFNFKYLELTTPIKNLIIDTSDNPTKLNNPLLEMIIRWEDFPIINNTFGYHIADTYSEKHFHIFNNVNAIIPFMLYCAQRTWISMKALENGTLLQKRKRLNHGIIIKQLPDEFYFDEVTARRINNLLSKIMALNIMSPIINNYDRSPFYKVRDDMLSLLDSITISTGGIISDNQFLRIKTDLIPVTERQVELMDEYGIKYVTKRMWFPQNVPVFNENSSVLEKVKIINAIPSGTHVTAMNNMIIHYPKQSRKVVDFSFTNGIPFDLFKTDTYKFLSIPDIMPNQYQRIKTGKLEGAYGLEDQTNNLIEMLDQNRMEQSINEVTVSTLYKSTLPGVILHSYVNKQVPTGIITVEDNVVTVDYINITNQGTKRYSPLELLFNINLMNYVSEFLKPLYLGPDVLEHDRPRKISFVNYKERLMNYSNLFPNWTFSYYNTDNESLGINQSFNQMVLNVNSNIMFIKMSYFNHTIKT